MVRASYEMTASPYEAEELGYLAALCDKIREDHSLVLLFIQVCGGWQVGYPQTDAQRVTRYILFIDIHVVFFSPR